MKHPKQNTQQTLLWKVPEIDNKQRPITVKTSSTDNPFGDEKFIGYEIEFEVVVDHLAKMYKSWTSAIREYIANAESACISAIKNAPNNKDYAPNINITYEPSTHSLTIDDNGIGISKQVFTEVFKYFGRSRNAFDSTTSGKFGLGAKSFIMLVGSEGSMIMHTKSRETNETYKMYARKLGFDVLPNTPRDYGTSFTFVHDPTIVPSSIISSVLTYSEFVKVPVYLTIIDNGDQPELCKVKTNSPTLISINTIKTAVDTAIKQSTSPYKDTINNTATRVSISNEFYDFEGFIQVAEHLVNPSKSKPRSVNTPTITPAGNLHSTIEDPQPTSTPEASLPPTITTIVPGNSSSPRTLLISMLTGDSTSLLPFNTSYIQIKTEDGPVWLPKPTPDRERFQDTNLTQFQTRLHKDIITELLKVTGNFDTIEEFFKLKREHIAIWEYILTSGEWFSYIDGPKRIVMRQACCPVHLYKLKVPCSNTTIETLSDTTDEPLFNIIHNAIREKKKIYLAKSKWRLSAKTKALADTITEQGHLVVLNQRNTTETDAIIKLFPDLFNNIDTVKPTKVKKQRDNSKITYTTTRISSYDNKADLETHTIDLVSLKNLKKQQVIVFKTTDKDQRHRLALCQPSYTCNMNLFVATKDQIKWIHENTELLTLNEYVEYAGTVIIQTNQGPMTIDQISNIDPTTMILHSVTEQIGTRLNKVITDKLYVPLSNVNYMEMVSVLINKDIQYTLTKDITQYLGLTRIDAYNPANADSCTTYVKEILAYATITLSDPKDIDAIKGFVKRIKSCDNDLDNLIHIIDRLRIAQATNNTETIHQNENITPST